MGNRDHPYTHRWLVKSWFHPTMDYILRAVSASLRFGDVLPTRLALIVSRQPSDFIQMLLNASLRYSFW